MTRVNTGTRICKFKSSRLLYLNISGPQQPYRRCQVSYFALATKRRNQDKERAPVNEWDDMFSYEAVENLLSMRSPQRYSRIVTHIVKHVQNA